MSTGLISPMAMAPKRESQLRSASKLNSLRYVCPHITISAGLNERAMSHRNLQHLRITVGLIFFFALAQAASAQERPVITEDVDIIPPGTLRIEAGIDFLQGSKFPVSGLTGDETRVGVIGVTIGFAPNVEFQIEGVAQNFLSINTRGPSAIPLSLAPGANSTNGPGDFILWTKFKLRNETRRGPSLGFRVGGGLPNSNQATGIGLNQTNAYGSILVGKKFGRNGRFNTFGNLGVAILTAPTRLFTQNDVVTYGLAGTLPLNNQIIFSGGVNRRAHNRPNRRPPGAKLQSRIPPGVELAGQRLRLYCAR